jgi:hypothetical protein
MERGHSLTWATGGASGLASWRCWKRRKEEEEENDTEQAGVRSNGQVQGQVQVQVQERRG